MPDAAEKAVDQCISENILRDFFMEQKNEVVAMSIYEYNEEYVMQVTYEDGKEHAVVQMVEAVMKNLNMNLEEACQVHDISVEEYQRAKRGQISWKQ